MKYLCYDIKGIQRLICNAPKIQCVSGRRARSQRLLQPTLNKLTLIKNIIRPNNLIATLSHRMLLNSQIDHGTERLFLFTRDEDRVVPTSQTATESDGNCHKPSVSLVNR